MTLEDLLTECASRQWFIGNLFQLAEDHWRCNLTRNQPGLNREFTEYGEGVSALDALSAAMEKQWEFAEDEEGSEVGIYKGPEVGKINLVAALGLVKPIARRI